jgi:glutamine cyclotransferase
MKLDRGDGTVTETPKVRYLNELEWDPTDGTILANVWMQNVILRIVPTSGQVLRVYDMSQLYTNRIQKADVLNGIAFLKKNHFWITGKYWPNLYLVEFLE